MMNITFLYSCNCYKHYPINYLDDIPPSFKSEWKTCNHVVRTPGKWIKFAISDSNTAKVVDELRRDAYFCVVCKDLFILPWEEDEYGEPKLCSKSCAYKFSH